MRSFLKRSLNVFSRKIPQIRWFSIGATAGKQTYEIPRDQVGYGLTKVLIPRIDPIAPLLLSSGPRLDIFGYRYSSPYRNISEIYLDYFYFREASRILSSDFKWEFMDNRLLITPKPDVAFTLTFASAFPHNLDTFPAANIDWLQDHLLAQVKIAVGSVRRKMIIPGAQTAQKLDGDQLVQEGTEELRAAEEKLRQRTAPFPLFRN
jgi:hypothetical protein